MGKKEKEEIKKLKKDVKKLREDLDKHFERHLSALERRKQQAKESSGNKK